MDGKQDDGENDRSDRPHELVCQVGQDFVNEGRAVGFAGRRTRGRNGRVRAEEVEAG